VTLRFPAWLLCVPVLACTTRDIVIGDLREVTAMRALPNRDLDLLFVIDNSASMADKQEILKSAVTDITERSSGAAES